MPRSLLAALILAAATFGGVLAPATGGAHAQGAINVVSSDVRNEFPRGVTFALTFSAPAAPKEVRIQYRLAPDGTGATAIANCTGTATVSCTYTLTSGAGIFIIPGAEITYHWDIADEAGSKLSTEDALYVHQDTRFTFQPLTQGNITVYYHSGTDTQAQAILDVTQQTLDKVGALEGAQVTFPIKVFLYTTADEMQPAIAPGGAIPGSQILGEVVYSDTAMVSADVATLDIVRHEVAHIVTREATKGPFGIESWMNEGISVFSQAQPLAGHESALSGAIRTDHVYSMRELNSWSSATAANVGLAYGQAGSIVKYLVDTYGEDKFRTLIKTFKDGSTQDKGFQSVYGFDQLGLENAWRASVGLEPRSASATPTPRATEESRGGSTPVTQATAAASASSDSDGTSSTTIVIIIGLTAALLAMLAGAALVVMRRM